MNVAVFLNHSSESETQSIHSPSASPSASGSASASASPSAGDEDFYTTEDGADFYVFDGTTDKVIVEP